MTVTSPSPTVYLVHERDQVPIDGTAVYLYSWGWKCEDDGPRPGRLREPCEHIKKSVEFRFKGAV